MTLAIARRRPSGESVDLVEWKLELFSNGLDEWGSNASQATAGTLVLACYHVYRPDIALRRLSILGERFQGESTEFVRATE